MVPLRNRYQKKSIQVWYSKPRFMMLVITDILSPLSLQVGP